MRNAFINTILDACAGRDDIFIISGDAGLGVFDTFKDRHPDRFLNLGAAEQNMIGFAAGLAITGYKVVLYNIIPFVLYRCYEQVRNDICYQDLPVILAGIGSGVTYAPQGMTHYSIEDLALARTMPNLEVFSPIDPVEARLAAKYALSARAPVYVRLAKRGEPDIHRQQDLDITKPQVLAEGEAVALLCHGSIGEEAMRAVQILHDAGIRPRVLSVPMVQPLNRQALAEALQGIGAVLTVEEHYRSCGFGAAMGEFLRESGLTCSLTTLGVPSRFIHEIHDTAGMRRLFGIDAVSIAAKVKQLL
ncbi:transketolase, B protein, putative [Geotalea daltonii FRC-32]|uniref:Transketolase, B protein, putative n=1 Tax=Geotalea daltonii (strain DSM 22248 / JCM 15807 / FRC-32) TaxID=316067 RepID=B9M0J4_GEODF|nr:transketolase C-terminal domain-containing protein [Geotalea daltonii]ACM19031.1 transketolase, B protein, putative [Geotalea daltonii FRC-32]